MSLYKKTALITGSTSGIGAGIAEKFAANNINVVITGLVDDKNNLDHLLEKLKSYHVKAIFVDANLTEENSIDKLVDTSLKEMNAIDILINNAGMQYVSSIIDFPQEKWDLVLALNLTVPFKLTKRLLPNMRKNNFGRIINIASAHGIVASVNKSAYVASKHGLVGLTKVVALETAQENITANAICPGWVLTPLVKKQIDAIAEKDNIPYEQAEIKLLSEKQPSHRFVTPEQIASLALFLSSDDAQQITGTTQLIDGGWTAQ